MILSDFSFVKYDDGILSVSMIPQVPIGAWDIRFQVTKHFGGQSGTLIQRTVASGFSASSGITIVNSGAGIFNVTLREADTSGLSFGNYAVKISRFNSGLRTVLDEGFLTLTP